MGKPKFSTKKYEKPSRPWQEDRIKEENELIKKYGLKNKREIWKAETVLRKYRSQARELLAKIRGGEPQIKKESNQLLMHLTRMNILPPNSTLDDVLALETESILSRRLQTLTYLKGLANTPKQARQLISQGHIEIGGRRVTIPSYRVTKEEEDGIGYAADSPLNDTLHPARPRADFKSIPVRKEKKTEEESKKKEEKKPVDEKESKSKEKSEETKAQTEKVEKTSEEQKKVKPKKKKEIKDEKKEPSAEKTGEKKSEETKEKSGGESEEKVEKTDQSKKTERKSEDNEKSKETGGK